MSRVVEVTWRGLKFTGDGSGPYHIRNDGFLFGRTNNATRQGIRSTSGHGNIPVGGHHGPAVVQLEGWIFTDPGDFAGEDQLMADLADVMAYPAAGDDDTEALRVVYAGRTRAALVQLSRFAIDYTGDNAGTGAIPFTVQWDQPDPRVYADRITVGPVPLIVDSAGAELPQHMPFHMPAKPIGGQLTVTNPGTDVEGSPAVITLTGPQVGSVGVTNAQTGARVGFDFPLFTGDTLVIDAELGIALLNGEHRSPLPWSSIIGDLRAVPGTNVYRATGTATSSDATIAVRVDPRLWY